MRQRIDQDLVAFTLNPAMEAPSNFDTVVSFALVFIKFIPLNPTIRDVLKSKNSLGGFLITKLISRKTSSFLAYR